MYSEREIAEFRQYCQARKQNISIKSDVSINPVKEFDRPTITKKATLEQQIEIAKNNEGKGRYQRPLVTNYRIYDTLPYGNIEQNGQKVERFNLIHEKRLFSMGEDLATKGDTKEIVELCFVPYSPYYSVMCRNGEIQRNKRNEIQIGTKSPKIPNPRNHKKHNAHYPCIEYKYARIAGQLKNGTYLVREIEGKKEIIQIGNPKRKKTAQWTEVWTMQKRKRELSTGQPNKYSQKNKSVIDELRKQGKQNLNSLKRMDLMIRKTKK